MDITTDKLLALALKQGASDLHLSAGLPPMIRVDGVRRINLPALDHGVGTGVHDIMNDKRRKGLRRFHRNRL